MNAVDRLADGGDATPRQARAGTPAYPAVSAETSASKGSFLAGAVLLALVGLNALAGIPEPGIVLYGVVTNTTDGARLTSGTLVWTYSNSLSGAVSVTGMLSNVGGQFSYVITIPFETAVTNEAVVNALPLTSGNTTYQRFATVGAIPASIGTPRARDRHEFGGHSREREI